jgi:hypothetical protein
MCLIDQTRHKETTMSNDNKQSQQQPKADLQRPEAPKTPITPGTPAATPLSEASVAKQKIVLCLRAAARKMKVTAQVLPETANLWDLRQAATGLTGLFVIPGERYLCEVPFPVGTANKAHMSPADADGLLEEWQRIIEGGELRK